MTVPMSRRSGPPPRSSTQRLSPWPRKPVHLRLLALLLIYLIFGGASQGEMTARPYLIGLSLLVLGYVVFRQSFSDHVRGSKLLTIIFGSVIIVGAAHLIPLPPDIWTGFPGRAVIAEGFAVIEQPLPWLPFSMMPEVTELAILSLLPPIAVYALVRNHASEEEIKFTVWGLLAFAVLTLFLGIFQVQNPGGALHFYATTNEDLAVGFFANANHQATFLLIVLALTWSYVLNTRRPPVERIIFGLGTITLIAGLALNSSVAGFLIMAGISVIAVFLFPFSPMKRRQSKVGKVGLISVSLALPLLAIFAVSFLSSSEIFDRFLLNISPRGELSRWQVLVNSWDITLAHLPFGTGWGSYPSVYRLYENPLNVTNVYLPYAHNEYIELLVEFGIFALIWIALFLVWFAMRGVQLFTGLRRNRDWWQAAGAWLAILAVLIHSLVDYPARTLAIAVLFALCFGLIERLAQKRKA